MTEQRLAPTVQRDRELVVSYKPLWVSLPVNGTASSPRGAASLAATILADTTVEKVLALHLDTKHRLIGVHVVSVAPWTPPWSIPGMSSRRRV